MTRLRAELAPLLAEPRPRITVFRSGGLGDTLLVMPALQDILSELPSARLTLVGSAWAERLLPLLAFPLTVVCSDSPALLPLFSDEERPDSSGLLSEAAAAIVFTSGAADRLTAAAHRLCRGVVVEWPAHPTGADHAAVHFARAVLRSPSPAELPPPALAVPGDLDGRARAWLDARLGPAARPVAVHPGSGGPRKCWPAKDMAQLLARLPAPLLLLEGPADADALRRLAPLLPEGRRLEVARGLSVPQAAALLAQCRLYVGNDSGLSHLAAALGAPTVAVFGPTDPAVWAPRGPTVRVVQPEPPAAWPDADRVAAAARSLLSETA